MSDLAAWLNCGAVAWETAPQPPVPMTAAEAIAHLEALVRERDGIIAGLCAERDELAAWKLGHQMTRDALGVTLKNECDRLAAENERLKMVLPEGAFW